LVNIHTKQIYVNSYSKHVFILYWGPPSLPSSG